MAAVVGSMTKPIAIAVSILVGVIAIVLIYLAGKGAGDKPKKRPKPYDLPNNGTGIPVGWSPTPSAQKLYSAMKGPGTDVMRVYGTLEDKTDDQLVAIVNEFDRLYFDEYGEDFFAWVDGEAILDKPRVYDYFQGTGISPG